MTDKTLQQFRDEVLCQGALACLPDRLSREWLDLLADQPLGDDAHPDDGQLIFMAALLVILQARKGRAGGQLSFSGNEIFGYIERYKEALGRERYMRETGAKAADPLTPDTVFV